MTYNTKLGGQQAFRHFKDGKNLEVATSGIFTLLQYGHTVHSKSTLRCTVHYCLQRTEDITLLAQQTKILLTY